MSARSVHLHAARRGQLERAQRKVREWRDDLDRGVAPPKLWLTPKQLCHDLPRFHVLLRKSSLRATASLAPMRAAIVPQEGHAAKGQDIAPSITARNASRSEPCLIQTQEG